MSRGGTHSHQRLNVQQLCLVRVELLVFRPCIPAMREKYMDAWLARESNVELRELTISLGRVRPTFQDETLERRRRSLRYARRRRRWIRWSQRRVTYVRLSDHPTLLVQTVLAKTSLSKFAQ